jgi:uncharacterized protein YjbJ (UPF0337 family)
MNKHQLKGRISQTKGRAKELIGKLFGNRSLQGKGSVEKTGGKMQAGYGDLKDDVQKTG